MTEPMIRRTTRYAAWAVLGLLPAAFARANRWRITKLQSTLLTRIAFPSGATTQSWESSSTGVSTPCPAGLPLPCCIPSQATPSRSILMQSGTKTPCASLAPPRRNITVNTLAQTTTTTALPTALTVKARSGILDRERKSLRTPAPNTLSCRRNITRASLFGRAQPPIPPCRRRARMPVAISSGS